MTLNRRGLTLIELLTAMACLAILTAFVIPEWGVTSLPAYRLKHAARQVVSDVRYARMRAVTTNRQYRLRFDPGSDSYLMERGNAPQGSLSWIMEGTVRRFGSNESSTFPGVNIVGEKEYTMVFRPTGGMTAGTILLRNPLEQTTKIVCSLAGRIQLIKES